MATAQEKFDAAVNVIHGLPKDGPFQPSYEMMLTFYGLYKQAKEGKCNKPKPWSWDIVAKKKWDAWDKLGDMPKEHAMELYVEELKKTIGQSTDKWNTMSEKEKRIVEAMPQEKPVRDFMETIGSFYELIDEKTPFEEKEQYVVQQVEGLDKERIIMETAPHNKILPALKHNEQIPEQDIPVRETIYDNLEHPAEETIREPVESQVTSGSESDDEFLDSSDIQPFTKSISSDLNTENDILKDKDRSRNSQKKKNVHFSPNTKSELEYSQDQVGYESLLRNGTIPNQHMSSTGPTAFVCSRCGSQQDTERRFSDTTDRAIKEQILVTLQQLQRDQKTVLNRLEKGESQQSGFRIWPLTRFRKEFLFVLLWPMIIYWFFGRRRQRSK